MILEKYFIHNLSNPENLNPKDRLNVLIYKHLYFEDTAKPTLSEILEVATEHAKKLAGDNEILIKLYKALVCSFIKSKKIKVRDIEEIDNLFKELKGSNELSELLKRLSKEKLEEIIKFLSSIKFDDIREEFRTFFNLVELTPEDKIDYILKYAITAHKCRNIATNFLEVYLNAASEKYNLSNELSMLRSKMLIIEQTIKLTPRSLKVPESFEVPKSLMNGAETNYLQKVTELKELKERYEELRRRYEALNELVEKLGSTLHIKEINQLTNEFYKMLFNSAPKDIPLLNQLIKIMPRQVHSLDNWLYRIKDSNIESIAHSTACTYVKTDSSIYVLYHNGGSVIGIEEYKITDIDSPNNFSINDINDYSRHAEFQQKVKEYFNSKKESKDNLHSIAVEVKDGYILVVTDAEGRIRNNPTEKQNLVKFPKPPKQTS